MLVQFWPHLPESLQEGHIKVLGEGAPETAQCPGPGQAAAGYMCVDQSFNEGMSFESFISTMPGSIYAGGERRDDLAKQPVQRLAAGDLGLHRAVSVRSSSS